MQLATKPPVTVSAQIGLAAIPVLAPNWRACNRSSSPNTKLKFNIDEKIPEKMQMMSPKAKPERPPVPACDSRSRARPASASNTSPRSMTPVPVIRARPRFVSNWSEWRIANGSSDPKEAVIPRIRANPSAIPTRLIPSPNNVAPTPHSNPKRSTLIRTDGDAVAYTPATFGTVAEVMIHGSTSRPEAAKTSQVFSHCHPVTRFMGAAKLPLRTPARMTTTSPDTTFPLISSPLLEPLRQSKTEQG